MLLQRRSLRSRLDLLRGECAVQKRVLDSQQRQVEYAGGVPREFALGDKVWARDFGSNDKWVKGVIEQKEGSRRYILGNGDGQRIKRHIDQIRRRSRLSDVTCPDVANDVERASNGPEDEFADACSDLQTEGVASATERKTRKLRKRRAAMIRQEILRLSAMRYQKLPLLHIYHHR
ncbi:unnamed protein product, partial [Iphiclides podalirius]